MDVILLFLSLAAELRQGKPEGTSVQNQSHALSATEVECTQKNVKGLTVIQIIILYKLESTNPLFIYLEVPE